MKRYFYVGIAVILALVVALVVYGTWLNVSDEKQIARRMDEQVLTLTGARVRRNRTHSSWPTRGRPPMTARLILITK